MITLTRNNITKRIPEGFSFTTFFLGIFVPINRGMWPQVLITFLSFGLANFYYIFSLNRIYKEKLLEDGWKEVDDSQYAGA